MRDVHVKPDDYENIRVPYTSATSKLCNEFSSLPPTLYINIMTTSKSVRGIGVFFA
jgi:hypothetical protein